MIEIREKQHLLVEKLYCYRGKFKISDADSVLRQLETEIEIKGGKKKGNPITVTYAEEGNMVDMEILIPVDRTIDTSGKYIYKEKIEIVNAVEVKYIGKASKMQEAYAGLNNYINVNNLNPITAGYNVTIKTGENMNDCIEVLIYAGINPNII
jgi:hypothetical protein